MFFQIKKIQTNLPILLKTIEQMLIAMKFPFFYLKLCFLESNFFITQVHFFHKLSNASIQYFHNICIQCNYTNRRGGLMICNFKNFRGSQPPYQRRDRRHPSYHRALHIPSCRYQSSGFSVPSRTCRIISRRLHVHAPATYTPVHVVQNSQMSNLHACTKFYMYYIHIKLCKMFIHTYIYIH